MGESTLQPPLSSSKLGSWQVGGLVVATWLAEVDAGKPLPTWESNDTHSKKCWSGPAPFPAPIGLVSARRSVGIYSASQLYPTV